LEHIAKNAKEIRNLFGDIYGFEVHKYAIRRDCDLQDFTFDITPLFGKLNATGKVYLYYIMVDMLRFRTLPAAGKKKLQRPHQG
jgi:hypothetical protein